MSHKQIEISDSVFVDEGIALLVEHLNAIPNLNTFESCQGDLGQKLAWVAFTFHGSHLEFADLIQRLQIKLRTDLNLCCEYEIRLGWSASSESPIGEIFVQPDYIETLALALATVKV